MKDRRKERMDRGSCRSEGMEGGREGGRGKEECVRERERVSMTHHAINRVLAVFIHYDTDRQKQHVRNTQGNCEIWGSRPQLIHATYT